jgi:glutathione peroxidase-family protein
MKKIIAIVTVILGVQLANGQIVYSLSIPKIEGGAQALSSFSGKKILIITLPTQQSASADSLLQQLDTLATARAATLKVIAVPAYEDGFTAAQKTQLRTWYRSKLNTNIIITDGLYTRKTSASQQHLLFKWLTTVTQNEQFNIDVAGPGYKFFVKPTGELYGVLLPQSKVGGASVQTALQIQ